MNTQKVMIDLSKIEVMQITSDTAIFIQFVSGTTVTYEFKDPEDVDLLYCAFVNWHAKERSSKLYIMWQTELKGVEA